MPGERGCAARSECECPLTVSSWIFLRAGRELNEGRAWGRSIGVELGEEKEFFVCEQLPFG